MKDIITIVNERCPCEMAWAGSSTLMRFLLSEASRATGQDGREKLVICTKDARQLVEGEWKPVHGWILQEYSELRFDLEQANKSVQIDDEGFITFTLPILGTTRIYPKGHASNVWTEA